MANSCKRISIKNKRGVCGCIIMSAEREGTYTWIHIGNRPSFEIAIEVILSRTCPDSMHSWRMLRELSSWAGSIHHLLE